ncbi:hypothetical protein GC173_01790 [bacterium]|nr:hypothetical protein [bacterium]
MKKALFCAGAILAASAASAASLSYDFNTDQSASFTSVVFGNAGTTSTDFSFDYSTAGIPAAPSGTGTIGLRTAVNIASTVANSLTLYPDTTTLNVADGDWQMTFDAYVQFGDNAGATTEFVGFGAQATKTFPGVGGDGDNGFNYILTCDGGSSNDYRYSSGTSSPMTGDNTAPNWWGTGEVNNAGTNWSAFFPVVGSSVAGSPGLQWVTIRLTVKDAGATRIVAFKKPGDADFTTVSTITGGIGSAANPCFGHADYFTGSAQTNQFVVFDNVVISDTGPFADVADWSVY